MEAQVDLSGGVLFCQQALDRDIQDKKWQSQMARMPEIFNDAL